MATAHNLGHSVIRHRLEPSPAVEIKLGIVPMLDKPAHKVLEDDLNVHASPWERLLAVENLADSLPQEAGLYMFVWRPTFKLAMADNSPSSFHQILYIGQAGGAGQQGNTLRNRYREYKKYLNGNPEALWATQPPDTRRGRLTHYLTLRPLEYWFTTIADRSQIENLETRLIDLYNPPANVQKRPKLHARVVGPRKPALRS
ncbi:hypothetical protein [Streptomyces sp. KMM 9044]|uniref:hypothetical protein n=1 Tax=Streptomyces sp. KMM 9044 TaxID=2744474 RepID=UPI002151E34F|nr:hypothetical protein [Streptomyces sp. KMM 9044]WAX78798.1 hypothetical protein HUV60_015010 [Streptomyces sp. KMM 9044]